MVNKKFTDKKTGISFWYQVNNTDDLIDMHDNPFLEQQSWVEFFGDKGLRNEREAKKKARSIVTDLFRMIADDLIENNDVFVFPQYRFGRVYVGNVSPFGKKSQGSAIDTDGKFMGMKLIINQLTNRYSAKMYRGRFNQLNSDRILEKVKSGHKY